jgi:SPP1 gp7 family putative phage head morphogenesis protein
MPDYGATVADKAIRGIDRKLQQTYKTARKELEEKLKDFEKRHTARDAMMRQRVQEGKMSQQEYQDWLAGQVFIRGQWQDKIRQVSAVLTDHDQQAAKIINERKLDVFAENYNHEAYVAEKTLGIGFGIYNTQAVAKLIQEDPQILPEWEIDKPKEYEWCYKKVNNIVKQGIIQGEGIPQITARLCRDLAAQSQSRMRLFARTAITGAQNAGRQQQMEDAAQMGIEIRKQWLATLDSRTRDAHRRLDGQEVPFDEPFKIDGQEINYPGDPTAHPALVYNCRCTVVSIYPKYEDRTKPDWRESETIDGQSYEDWKKGKKARGEVQPTDPKPGEPSQLGKKVQKQIERTPHKLTDAEHQAVEDYVSGDMMFINQILRGRAGDLTDNDKEFVKLMDSALSDQLGNAQTLFRSVDAEAVFGKISDSDYQNMNTYLLYGKDSFGKGNYADSIRKQVEGIVSRTDGNTITEKGYMSTTKDKELAFDWGGFTGSEKPVVLEIKAPPGTMGRDLKEFDIEGDEQQEVLLARGQKYKVTGIHGENGSIVVTAEIIERDEKGK